MWCLTELPFSDRSWSAGSMAAGLCPPTHGRVGILHSAWTECYSEGAAGQPCGRWSLCDPLRCSPDASLRWSSECTHGWQRHTNWGVVSSVEGWMVTQKMASRNEWWLAFGMEKTVVLVSGGKKPSKVVVQGDFVRFRKKGLSSFYLSGTQSRQLLKNVALGLLSEVRNRIKQVLSQPPNAASGWP